MSRPVVPRESAGDARESGDKKWILDRGQAREFDRLAMTELGVPGLVLMENAARGCVDELLRRGVRGPVAVLCGKGNNGGDGLAMVRLLAVRGVLAEALLLLGDGLGGDALANLRIARACGLACRDASDWDAKRIERELAGADWIVDAVLGTGAQGPLRAPLPMWFEIVHRLPARRLALDLPSGLDCDTGVADPGAFRAEVTCTMVAPKRGFVAHAEAFRWTGAVQVVDIGVPAETLRPRLRH